MLKSETYIARPGREHNWSALDLHKQRVRKLLTTDYMSSESSDEDDTDSQSIDRSAWSACSEREEPHMAQKEK